MKIIQKSQSTFSLAGWLIADLFLGLSMFFLIWNTKVPITTIEPSPSITLTPSPTITETMEVTSTIEIPTKIFITPTPLLGLNRNPSKFSVLANFDLLVNNSPSEIDRVAKLMEPFLKEFQGQRAGMVITLGYHNSGHIASARKMADNANAIFCERFTQMFNCDPEIGTIMKSYWWNVDDLHPVGLLVFEIYFYTE